MKKKQAKTVNEILAAYERRKEHRRKYMKRYRRRQAGDEKGEKR